MIMKKTGILTGYLVAFLKNEKRNQQSETIFERI